MRGVLLGTTVDVGGEVRVGASVCVGGRGVNVGEGPSVGDGVIVLVGLSVGRGVGGSPITTNCPELIHSRPTNSRSSYSPASH